MIKAPSLFLLLSLVLFSCIGCQRQADDNALYAGFTAPPSTARPFVRWWWNGNCLEKEELIREVELLHDAGFGGVEINPIAMPEWTDNVQVPAIDWLSDEWIRLLGSTIEALHEKGMTADLIVGSGWPFGGDFLKEDETIQCVEPLRRKYHSGDTLQIAAGQLYNPEKNERLLFASLVPEDASGTNQVKDLMPCFSPEKGLFYILPEESEKKVYDLTAGIHRQNYTRVILGAPGADGPIMNHYRKEITGAYLNRLQRIGEVLGRPLSELIRALFCDSIELSGSNWTDGFADIFYDTYGYRLEPYYPFIFHERREVYPRARYPKDFEDEVKRVRYDYNNLLVNTFLDNFTKVFHAFCKENGISSRYQAYGGPMLMGMMDGYMIPDIPEANNWLRAPWADIENRAFNWSPTHGTMIWNHYAASAAHHSGKKVVSCEAMTCLNNVFKISLEAIKNHDDMNFISGINHSVLHGFSYSPPEAGFPGWMRYGTYFSEQNTWWPYVHLWVDYNARLSYIFQESRARKTWAVLPPEGDRWSEDGLFREPFQTQPWYCFRLWEAFSQAGSSLDYVNEHLLQGEIPHEGVILCDVTSISPETAASLEKFVRRGGKLVYVGGIPSRSLSMQDRGAGDRKVAALLEHIGSSRPEQVCCVEAPADSLSLLPWSLDLLKKTGVSPDIKIEVPDRGIYQIHCTCGQKEIYFFTNALRREEAAVKAVFPTGNRIPWIWNPEDGSRQPFPTEGKRNELEIHLGPLQSCLIVFEPETLQITASADSRPPLRMTAHESGRTLLKRTAPWTLKMRHADGRKKEIQSEDLHDFREGKTGFIRNFAGEVEYHTTFSARGDERLLLLGKTNNGIAEVFINGEKAGTCWYGLPLFPIKGLLHKGQNRLCIKYTSVLSNYCQSLKDNPAARRWTYGHHPIPCGLTGDVYLCR